MNNNKLVSIGVLSKTHGIKGELKAFLYNDDSNTLIPGIIVWIKINTKYKPYKIESIRGIIKKLIIKLENFNSIEESKMIINKKIYVSRDDFPEIDKGFYFNDIIGFKIKDNKNNLYGTLIDIIVIGSSEVLLIDYLKKEVLIPNVKEFVQLFDFENKQIIINNFEQFLK